MDVLKLGFAVLVQLKICKKISFRVCVSQRNHASWSLVSDGKLDCCYYNRRRHTHTWEAEKERSILWEACSFHRAVPPRGALVLVDPYDLPSFIYQPWFPSFPCSRVRPNWVYTSVRPRRRCCTLVQKRYSCVCLLRILQRELDLNIARLLLKLDLVSCRSSSVSTFASSSWSSGSCSICRRRRCRSNHDHLLLVIIISSGPGGTKS